MLYWLSQACKWTRERAGKDVQDVADLAGMGKSSIYRFEQGAGWPVRHDPDRVVAAYAKVAGVADARRLWELALRLWLEHGQAPDSENWSDQIADIVGRQIDKLRGENDVPF